jgi:hypothetical protein
LEHPVDPCEVTVRAIAAELGFEIHFGDRGSQGFRPLADLGFVSDVLPVNALILIEEEDGEGGGVDEFLDLVFTEIAEEAGFLVQAMGFVNDESAEGVGARLRKGSRADEKIGDTGFLEGLRELVLVDSSRSAVFRHILGDKSAAGKLDEEIDGDHRLAGTRTAVDDEDVFVCGG